MLCQTYLEWCPGVQVGRLARELQEELYEAAVSWGAWRTTDDTLPLLALLRPSFLALAGDEAPDLIALNKLQNGLPPVMHVKLDRVVVPTSHHASPNQEQRVHYLDLHVASDERLCAVRPLLALLAAEHGRLEGSSSLNLPWHMTISHLQLTSGGDSVPLLEEAISGLPSLISLSLTGFQIRCSFVDAITGCKALTRLKLDNCEASEETISALFTNINSLEDIHLRYLDGLAEADETYERGLVILPTNTRLQTLKVEGSYDFGLERIIPNIPSLTSLSFLLLREETLTQAIKSLTNLRRFSISALLILPNR